jgi:hypothetical protein
MTTKLTSTDLGEGGQHTEIFATMALQSTDHAASWRCSDNGCGFHGHTNAWAASENKHVDAVATEHGKLGGKTYA